MRLAGTRIAETVGLDLNDLPTAQRRRRLRIRGKGRKHRSVPVHTELGTALDAWLAERRSWPGSDTNPAVFLNRTGGRLSARAADTIVARIARAAGLTDQVTPHVLRQSFGTDLVRAGTDLVTVAELLGHASLDSTRIYALPPRTTSTPPSPDSPSTADHLTPPAHYLSVRASFGRPIGSNLLDSQRVVTQRESVSPILVARCDRRH